MIETRTYQFTGETEFLDGLERIFAYIDNPSQSGEPDSKQLSLFPTQDDDAPERLKMPLE